MFLVVFTREQTQRATQTREMLRDLREIPKRDFQRYRERCRVEMGHRDICGDSKL